VRHALAHIARIVRDYDEAIDWFSQKLGFTLVSDQYKPEQDKPGVISAEGGSESTITKRWVLVAPSGAGPTPPPPPRPRRLARAGGFAGNEPRGR